MAYYRSCPDCGCSLDPGEKCDCLRERAREQEARKKYFRKILRVEGSGQMMVAFPKEKGDVGA